MTREKISRCLKRSKNSKAPGPDGVLYEHLKVVQKICPNFLAGLLNKYLYNRIYSVNWKVAKLAVIPKGKVASLTKAGSYRPISLLSAMGKLYERILVSRVEQDYDARGLNSPSQFRFKASLSAEDAICKTFGTFKNTNKKCVLLLFIDIQSAFDNSWWPSILLSLIKVGISSYIFDRLKNYFSGRRVSLMAENRSMMISREAERGCPQRSIVGPYAWRWCMDELLNDARCEWSSDTVEWIAYADNIVIAVKSNSRFELERLSERCLSHLMSWCGRYKLRLSTPKTKCMLIKGHMDRSRMPRVLCAEKRIECVRQYKYFGIILDSVPNFVEQGKLARAKVSD